MKPKTLDRPRRAMVLAAGLGKRMRPLTATIPKPLIEVNGRALIDHGLDRLERAGVSRVVVNVHYLPELVRAHLARRRRPEIVISDERPKLLDTGGGIVKALPEIGQEPFYLLNSDSFWIEGARPNLDWLAAGWDDRKMDVLLLLSPTVRSIGYQGRGDFRMDPAGRLYRRTEREVVPFAYAGAAIVHPRLFAGAPDGAFSLNLLFDKAIEAERLFGVRMDGTWLHVGTPEAIAEAELSIADSAA
ncbi:MAG: nucleotidyltransferase family protein [Rhizobiales bacterium]|nr:nucleotidyltransferase family protein [Hyphomicrobiales bacterium]